MLVLKLGSRSLGATFHPSSIGMTQLVQKPTDLDQQLELLDTAGWILYEWPKNYIKHFQQTNEKLLVENLENNSIVKVFGNYYRHLFHVLKEPEFDFLRNQFGQFIGDEWNGLIRGSRKFIKEIDGSRKKWISPVEASTLFDGIPTAIFRRLVKKGVIKGKWLKEDLRGGRPLWLERDSVEEWVNKTKKWISRLEVQNRLGLHYHAVRALANSGIITFQKGGGLGKKVEWNFREQDVQNIIEAFEKHNVRKILHKDLDENQISFKDAMFRFLGFNKGLPDAISAVLEGKLIPTACINGIEGICGYTFSLSEIRKYRHTDVANSDSSLLTIQEASKDLKIDHRAVTALITAGYLKLADQQSFRNERLISAMDIASLKERYVFPRELAEPNEVSLVWVNRYLATIGIDRILISGNKYYTFMYERRLVDNLKIPQSKNKMNSRKNRL